MYQILFFLLVLAANCPLQADIGVSFPVTEKPKDETKLRIIGEAIVDDLPEAVGVDGTIVYFSGAHYYGGKTQEPERFDKLKEGMKLREIVSLLGPGSQNKSEGIGFITWRCKDGRILQVWPTNKIDEKAKYHISRHGSNQRHKDVGRLAKTLIARLDITKQKVAVILTEDTHQAKAGEVKIYEVGQTFQKVDPLLRIDFSIAKIEGESLYCNYFYQAAPQGLLRYSERGTLILHNREQDGADQLASPPESKSEGKKKPEPVL